MSAWPVVQDTNVIANATVTTTTETVAATITGVLVPGAGARVKLIGQVTLLTGTGTTAVTVRWRRGTTIAGTEVGTGQPIAAGAAVAVDLAYEQTDTPPDSSALTYVMTVQQTAAAANGTVQQVAASATV